MEIVNIRDWKSAELRTIKITQDVKGRSYQVKVRQFEPKEGDALERKWKINGVEQSFRCAPYAIADMEEAGVRYWILQTAPSTTPSLSMFPARTRCYEVHMRWRDTMQRMQSVKRNASY